MSGDEHMAFLSAGTDGTDGPTTAAGGIVDGNTHAALQAAGVDVDGSIGNHDSYNALGKVEQVRLETGPTDTNVTDLHLLAVEGKTNARRKR